MSQTLPETSATDGKEFLTDHKEGWRDLRKRGLRNGPEYHENESAPLGWYDQVFERDIAPTGSLTCEEALLVGGTQNGLDVILVGSHSNKGPVSIASGATITLKTLIADNPDGPFIATGPSLCVAAPAEGIACEPDALAVRFAIGNFKKQWLKISLEFSGTISGGTFDAALGFVPR